MSLRRAFYISFGSSGGNFLLSFGSNIILSRLLLPSEIGIFSVAVAMIVIPQALREFGVGRYLIQEQDLTDDKIRTVFGVGLLLGWSLAALIFFSRGAMAEFYSEPRIEGIFALLSINFLLVPFGQSAGAILRREQNYSRLATISLGTSLISTCISIAFAWLGFGPMALVYGALANTGFSTVFLLLSKPGHISLLPSLREWRSVCRFGGITSLATVIVQVGVQAPELLLGRFLGFTSVGLYSRGLGIARIVDDFLGNAMTWVTGAELAVLNRSARDLADLVLKTTDYILIIGWPILIFLSLKAEAIIWLLYGEAWLPAVPLAQALCLARGLHLIVTQASAVYEGTGAINLMLRNEIIVQIISVGLLFIGAQYSLLMVVWLRVLFGMVVVVVHFSVFRRYADIGMRRMFFAIWRSIAVALGFGGALGGMIALEPAGMLHSPLLLAGEAIIMGIIYLVLVVIIRHPIAAELLTTARTLLPKGWNPR